MTHNNPEAQYYQAVVTDLTSSNERLTEQNAQRLEHLERLRAECVDLRTIAQDHSVRAPCHHCVRSHTATTTADQPT